MEVNNSSTTINGTTVDSSGRTTSQANNRIFSITEANSQFRLQGTWIEDGGGVFEVQADAAFPIADLFGNFDIVYTTAGSTVTGISGAELKVADGGTGTTLSVKAIDISEDTENSDVS